MRRATGRRLFSRSSTASGAVTWLRCRSAATDGVDSLVVENDGKAEAIFLHGITAGQNLHVALQAALDETIAGSADSQGHELSAR